MTLDELINAARDALDDHVQPYQFSDAYLTGFFNEAVSEACLRTRVLQDSDSQVCSIALIAGTASYKIDQSIFAVRRARLDGQRHPLDPKDTRELDNECPGWDDPTLLPAGTPRYVTFDFGTGKLVLTPRPVVNGTLRLLVWRGPTDVEKLDVNDTNGEPVLPEPMHRELKHWAVAHALLNPDSEARNPTLAREHFGLFEAAYGRKPDLHEIRLWSTNRRTRIRAHFD